MKVVLLLVSLVALVAGSVSFGREYGVAYFSRSPEFSIFENLSSDADLIRLPYSARGMRELFAVCGSVQQGIIYRLQTPEVTDVIDGKCRAFSEAALKDSPTYSAAHTIKMMSSAQPDDIRTEMVLSQKTSASESWDAKLRLSKSIVLYGTGQADFDTAVRDDITFLAQSHGGRIWLAALYNQTPVARAVLTQTIDLRPNAEKADFLQKVRASG